MQYKKLSLLFYLITITTLTYSQIDNQDIHFRSPVDFPIYLSGNFGEIRSTHFHSGIDIKTQGVTGKKVHAVEGGYISRIKISVNSYGKTLYIDHPNGYTTVYGHLSKFNPTLEKIAKKIEYENNEYEINYFPKPNELPVKKGDVIAYSGNTGSSEGPHLHFEIRETKNQIPVNPLFFHFHIKDNIAPVLYNLVIYPLSKNSKVDGKNEIKYLKLKKTNGSYSIEDTNKIYLSGKIGFGLEMYDYLNGSRNRCGIYNLSAYVDSLLIYNYSIDKFSFYETGYVKSHVDYAEKVRSKRTIQKTFIQPNNNLSIYKTSLNRGIFDFVKDTLYKIEFIAKDAYENKSQLLFNVLGQVPDTINVSAQDSLNGVFMDWKTENTYENDEVKIDIPKHALFDTMDFRYSKSKPGFKAYSNLHHIHNIYTPLYKDYSLSIETIGLPSELSSKAVIAQVYDGKFNSIGGEVVNSHIVAEANTFGDFVVLLDTLAPEVKPLCNFNDLKDNKISFLIKDDLSGIKSYNGYIDNNWALFEYDQKNDLLFYIIDKDKIKKGIEHELELFVIDNKDNVTTYYKTFYW